MCAFLKHITNLQPPWPLHHWNEPSARHHLPVDVMNAQRRLAEVAVIGARKTWPLLCRQLSRVPSVVQAMVVPLKLAFANVVTCSPMLVHVSQTYFHGQEERTYAGSKKM